MNISKITEVANEITPRLTEGAGKLQEYGIIPELLNDLSEGFKELAKSGSENIKEFKDKVIDSLAEYAGCHIENLKYLEENEKEDHKLMAEIMPEYGEEYREFGLAKCTEAAMRYFNEGVLENWRTLTSPQKKMLCMAYAKECAKAFELTEYNGIYFEAFEDPTVGGENCGDGVIHVSIDQISPIASPFMIVDTITHELRHQYQHECILGDHNVPDSVRKEWAIADLLYNENAPSSFDPWGYLYNPQEIDSRYSGETVVRNYTKAIFSRLYDEKFE